MSTRFRTSFTAREGTDPARIVQGRVINANLNNWTVDIRSQFDRKNYHDIQVGAPYLHHNNGEGLSIFPEVGSTCMVCLPSDSSAPFVLCFIMAHETVDSSSADAPDGTRSHGAPSAHATDASFAGGRPKAKPGDIFMRGRDNNFVILHRGGVLQIGSTELAQRIYIPLNNQVMDISENYAHHNAGGSVVWGLQDGPSLEKYPTSHMETLRVFANDKYADIRITRGNVYAPLPDNKGGKALAGAGLGDQLVYEVVVSPKGFIAQTGEPATGATAGATVLRFVFDRDGNTFYRCEGNLGIKVSKKITLEVDGGFDFSTSLDGSITAKTQLILDGTQLTWVKGQLVRLGEGKLAVARITDTVETPVVGFTCSMVFAGAPVPNSPVSAVLTAVTPLKGAITKGNPAVLA